MKLLFKSVSVQFLLLVFGMLSKKKLLWTHDSDSYICASIAPVIYAYPQILMVA